ncbi:MAG: ABC transporter ATP-binding protein [Actinomycetota bacterium]|nr:ABC transporter ATP-binding protein [Actinomycetota bacterium]
MESIAVSQLSVHRRGVLAVDSVSFTARAGEVTVLLGPNGAGKTTTVETLEGYLRPDRGSVRVLGLDPAHQRAELTPTLGVMLQEGGIYPPMTSARAISLFASYYANPLGVDELLGIVGLSEVAGVPAKRLSGGQRRRLALALALVGRPRVVFLDEPTAGVDPEGRLAIRGVIEQLRGEGVCILLTTHELEEAERLADHLVLLRAGTIVADGTPAELLGGADEIRFAAAVGLPTEELAARLGAAVREERPGEYRVARAPDPAALAGVTTWLAERGVALDELRGGRRRLEEVFLELLVEEAQPREAAPGRRGRRRR